MHSGRAISFCYSLWLPPWIPATDNPIPSPRRLPNTIRNYFIRWKDRHDNQRHDLQLAVFLITILEIGGGIGESYTAGRICVYTRISNFAASLEMGKDKKTLEPPPHSHKGTPPLQKKCWSRKLSNHLGWDSCNKKRGGIHIQLLKWFHWLDYCKKNSKI